MCVRQVTLTELNLRKNGLEAAGGQALAAALRANATLTSLNLALNALGKQGGSALGEALAATGAAPALTALDLKGNQLDVEAFASAVRGHAALRLLNLRYHAVSPPAEKKLLEAVKGRQAPPVDSSRDSSEAQGADDFKLLL